MYHYLAVPVSLALIPASLVHTVLNFSLGSVILVVATIILHLTVFLARDYAKKNQDRIIRSELRLRYYQLTRQRLEEIEEPASEPRYQFQGSPRRPIVAGVRVPGGRPRRGATSVPA